MTATRGRAANNALSIVAITDRSANASGSAAGTWMCRRSLPSRASLAVLTPSRTMGTNATVDFSGRTASQVWVSSTAPYGVRRNQTTSGPRTGSPSIVTTSPWRNESMTCRCVSLSGAGASLLSASMIKLCCVVLRRCMRRANECARRRRRFSTELFAFHLVIPGPEQLVGGERCSSHNALFTSVLAEEGVKDAGLGLPCLEDQHAALRGVLRRQVVNDATQLREQFEVSRVDPPACCPQVDSAAAHTEQPAELLPGQARFRVKVPNDRRAGLRWTGLNRSGCLSGRYCWLC